MLVCSEDDRVAVEWEDIGEGVLGGEFDPENPDDEPRLRFTVLTRGVVSDQWIPVDDGSYCTDVHGDTEVSILIELAQIILADVGNAVCEGESIKKACERLSWMDASWAPSVEEARSMEVSEAGAELTEALRKLYRLFDGDGAGVGEVLHECDKAARQTYLDN